MLDKTHRCDACGAQAQTIAQHPEHTSLLFCGHHTTENVDALVAQGWVLVGEPHLTTA